MIIKNKTISTLSVYILTTGFVLFYFSDGMSKFLFREGAGFHRYGAFFKAFFEIFILVYSIFTLRKSKVSIWTAILILLSGFLIGQFFLNLNFVGLGFFENFNTLFKYLFPLILAFLLFDILRLESYPTLILKSYKFIMTLNGIFIILGFLLDIDTFRTYPGPWRFGFDGLIFAQNEASFIFIFALTIVYYRRFFLGIKEFFFWLILLTSLLVATKGVYLYFILLFLFHIYKKVSLRNILTFGISSLVIGYFLFSTAVNKILINSYDIFMYMYDKGGIWNALLSGRNEYINKKLTPLIFEQWSFPNIIFGGQDVVTHYIEMGFIDLVLFFGLFGSLIYFFVFYKIYRFLPFKKDFNLFFGIAFFTIVATAGHFFESGIAGMHFIIMILILRDYKDDTLDKENAQ